MFRHCPYPSRVSCMPEARYSGQTKSLFFSQKKRVGGGYQQMLRNPPVPVSNEISFLLTKENSWGKLTQVEKPSCASRKQQSDDWPREPNMD